MKNRSFVLASQNFLLALLLFILPCGTACADSVVFGQDDPRICLTNINRSLEEADAVAFEHLVDVDGILHQAVDFLLQETQKPQIAEQLPPVLALLFAQAASENAGQKGVRSLLTGAVRAFVMEGVSSGAFGGQSSGTVSSGLLAPLFADASMGSKKIRCIGQAQAVQIGTDGMPCWLVPFNVHDAGNDETYPVMGRICRQNRVFQLTAVENLSELFYRVHQEMTRQTE